MKIALGSISKVQALKLDLHFAQEFGFNHMASVVKHKTSKAARTDGKAFIKSGAWALTKQESNLNREEDLFWQLGEAHDQGDTERVLSVQEDLEQFYLETIK
jgi:hypothetical protein